MSEDHKQGLIIPDIRKLLVEPCNIFYLREKKGCITGYARGSDLTAQGEQFATCWICAVASVGIAITTTAGNTNHEGEKYNDTTIMRKRLEKILHFQPYISRE